MDWKKLLKPQYLILSLYVIATALLLYIGSKLVDHFGDLLKSAEGIFSWLLIVLKPLALGFSFAYLLSPVVEFWEKRLQEILPERRSAREKKGKGRGERRGCRPAALLLTFLLVILSVTLLLSLLVSALTSSVQLADMDNLWEMASGFAAAVNSFYQDILQKLSKLPVGGSDFSQYLQDGVGTGLSFLQGFLQGILSTFGNVGSFLSSFVFALIFCIYFLLDGENIARYWGRAFRLLFGERIFRLLGVFLSDADRAFSGYIRGQIIDAVIMMVLVSAVLALVGVKYALIIGILTGIGNLIPYTGPLVAYGSTLLICLLYGDYRRLLIALPLLFVIQTLDGNIINPKLLSDSVNVHPLLVIASLLIGGAAGGFLGMLIAVPVGSLLKIQFDRLLRYKEGKSCSAAGDPVS